MAISKMSACLAFACLLAPAVSRAESSVRPGFGIDVGFPSGAALNASLRPGVSFLALSVSLTYGLSLGVRGSVKLDPFVLISKSFPFGIFIDFQGGLTSWGRVPNHPDSPDFRYNYLNFYGGIRVGKPNGFHWNFEAGPSYINLRTNNFQSVIDTGRVLSVGNPTVKGWILPTFITGFEMVF